MKNRYNVAMPILIASLLLAGCTGGNKDDNPTGDGIITAPTEITVWTTFNATYQSVIDKAIEAVQKAEPNLTINYVKQSASYSGLKDMVVQGFSANTYPDVCVAYPDSVADFLNANKGLDITPYMNDEEIGWTAEEKADIYQAYLDEGSSYFIDGTYSLPIAKSTEAMYYNRAIIGLTLEGINGGNAITEDYINSLTWDEFEKLAAALLAYNETATTKLIKDTTKDYCVLGYDSDENLFITLAEQYGYGYTSIDEYGNGSIDFNNAEMKALMKKFNGYYKNHYIHTQGTYGNYTNYMFTAGQCIFTVGSTGGYTYQFSESNPMDVGVALIPQGNPSSKKVISQGPSLAFLDHNDENRAKGAWLFYKEWTSRANCIQWATTTGYSPIRKSVAESEAYIEYANVEETQEKTLDRLAARNASYAGTVGDYLFSSPVFVGSSTARNEVGGLTTGCLTAEDIDSTIDSLFLDAYNNANAVL